MRVLAFDTAGPDCSVVLARCGSGAPECLARRSERIGRGHAERLMPLIEAVLGEADLTYADIERIGVTTGPGSFTGVRVGVAAARALALALDVPAVGVGSLAALNAPALRTLRRGTAAAVLDARRGEVFALVQDAPSGVVVGAARAVRVEALAAELGKLPGPLVLSGGGAALVAKHLDAFDIADSAESPDILEVVRLAGATDAAGPPLPIYARGSDAETQAHVALARA